jgi:hypothetical protein
MDPGRQSRSAPSAGLNPPNATQSFRQTHFDAQAMPRDEESCAVSIAWLPGFASCTAPPRWSVRIQPCPHRGPRQGTPWDHNLRSLMPQPAPFETQDPSMSNVPNEPLRHSSFTSVTLQRCTRSNRSAFSQSSPRLSSVLFQTAHREMRAKRPGNELILNRDATALI